MTDRPRLLGAVLAGGMSRRLGRDKAAEVVGDVPLLERAVLALKTTCSDVVIVSSRPDTPAGAWTRIPDARQPCGPLGGIEAALDHAALLGYDGAFVLACDLPLVDSKVIETVAAALGSADASAPTRVGRPDFEPLCAAYRVSCRATLRTLLDSGIRATHTLFERLDGERVEVDGDVFLNVNTEADLARADAAVQSRTR